jgi:site-specific recombinase XerD
LRVSELINLRWDQVDFDKARIHVTRLKGSDDSVQPLAGVELRALRRLKRESPASSFVFISERGAPFTRDGFAKMLARIRHAAGFKWQVHPHMLRHACGYKLVNDGFNARVLQDYLGHRDPRHLVRYTKLSSKAFEGIWKD